MKPLLLLCSLLALPAALHGQADTARVWNSERALELISRAQQRRSASMADTGLVNFRADARLYVYFYLDRPESRERNLVKTDQLALDVLWQAPDQVKQRIVGWRDQKSLPTNINYHLDHLTVVLENFGDEIRLGDGDEVRNVPHPAAPDAGEVYDYRLADSLTLRLPGVTEPVRVYELETRPRDPSRPAFLGTVFVDQRAGDIVRMDFTFTRAAYVDRYLDYINISLDNGLWEGRYWLPNQQRVEIRRRIPQLDIPAGSVIRANMRVGNYRFNQPLPPQTFAGPQVVTVPRAQRESFDFEEPLLAEVREEGIGPQVELGEVRQRAAALVREEALRRVEGVGLRIPRASELFRYNRAEGLVLAPALGLTPAPGVRLGVQAGYAFGSERPLATITATTWGLSGSAYLNRPRDQGVGPVASGALNTLSSLFAGEDYQDLYRASGAELQLRRRLSPDWTLSTVATAERQSSATRGTGFSLFGGEFRPVTPIDDADLMLAGTAELRRDAPAEAGRRWTLAASLRSGMLDPPGAADRVAFAKPRVEAAWSRRWLGRETELALEGQAGAALGELPIQEGYRIGGRGTVPGYPFRSFGGDRFATGRGVLSAELLAPWIRGRLLGAAGWAAGELPFSIPTDGVRTSAGFGVGLFHDILRVDLARGLGRGGRWELIVEANPSFWDFL